MANHVCGFYYLEDVVPSQWMPLEQRRRFLPPLSLRAHSTIQSTTARTVLNQTFANPSDKAIPQLTYTFPLYDGVSVVAFTCTINDDRVIHGVVKEKEAARKTYRAAVDRGETAALLEQLPEAADVFTTTVGNVPADANLRVEITYLGELKHDFGTDGLRFTIPTSIAPRYGSYPGVVVAKPNNVSVKDGIDIAVDVQLAQGSTIKSIQSPSHPISINIGTLYADRDDNNAKTLPERASASLSLGKAELEADFVLQVNATNLSEPSALLEHHSRLEGHRALYTTFVPKFNLPATRPEIVFVCDRSGSMGVSRIQGLKSALQIFLKSLPSGVKFNICSFGSTHSFLFPQGSQSYSQDTLDKAVQHVNTFDSDYGGTEMYQPLEDTFKRRYKDMDLEVFLLTDGEIWGQDRLFDLINKNVEESKGGIRVFTLGIGNDVSHALIEGVARAGQGFSQAARDDERMNSKVIRMLKCALMPHVKDYSLEFQYAEAAEDTAMKDDGDDGFEMVDKIEDALTLNLKYKPADSVEEGRPPGSEKSEQKPISLFDPSAKPDGDDETVDSDPANKFDHLPAVDEPRFLQAPFQIPPLFPFNRTSVYILMGPSATTRMPKAVLLRGTSPNGPLELRIPVTVLPEKGEAIHQLAARKAVQDLEEGRGWLTGAKTQDGTLLKKAYEGRFQDMVEREAVRLGVTYQVSGKFCSFVAVEENSTAPEKPMVPDAEPTPTATRKARGGGMIRHRFMAANVDTVNSSFVPQSVPQSADKSSTLAACAARYSRPSGGVSLFGGPAAAGYGGGGGLFGAASGTLSMASPFGASPAKRARMAAPPPPPAPVPVAMEASSEQDLIDYSDEEFDAGAPGYSPASPVYSPVSVAPGEPEKSRPPQDPLDAIVSLHTFEGSWTWSQDLFGVLGIEGEKVKQGFGDKISAAGDDVMATLAVLAYLRKKMADREEEWEMLAGKAVDWVQGKGIDDVEAAIKAAEGWF